MPRLSTRKITVNNRLDTEIKEKTKFDASKYKDITKGKTSVYVEEIKATVFFKSDKDIPGQIEAYLSKLGVEAKQLINLRAKGKIQ